MCLDIYDTPTTLREQIAVDMSDGEAWFNPDEFGKYYDIEGKKVLSVFMADQRGKNIPIRLNTNENSEGIIDSRGVLFVRVDEIEGVKADQALNFEGRLYTVAEARIIQGYVWRIALEANES